MRVLLADDHSLFLEGLYNLLSAHNIEVVGMARNGQEAIEMTRKLHPDLILMDICMPGCNGLVATRQIKAEMPRVKIVMLSVSSNDEDLFEAVKSGASGYLLKSQADNRLVELIGQVGNGGAALSPELAARLLAEFARQAQHVQNPPGEAAPSELTPRQLEVLTLVAQGLTYPQVGEALHLSEPTVRYHMGEILERLHLKNRAQVIAYAAQHGLI